MCLCWWDPTDLVWTRGAGCMDVCVCGVLYDVAVLACHKTSTLLVNKSRTYFSEPLILFVLYFFRTAGGYCQSPKQGVSYHRTTATRVHTWRFGTRSCAQPRPPHSFLLRAKPYSARGLNPACCRGVPSCTRLRRGMWIARPERSSWLENSKRSPVVGPEVSAEGWQCASQRAGVRATS